MSTHPSWLNIQHPLIASHIDCTTTSNVEAITHMNDCKPFSILYDKVDLPQIGLALHKLYFQQSIQAFLYDIVKLPRPNHTLTSLNANIYRFQWKDNFILAALSTIKHQYFDPPRLLALTDNKSKNKRSPSIFDLLALTLAIALVFALPIAQLSQGESTPLTFNPRPHAVLWSWCPIPAVDRSIKYSLPKA